MAAETKASVVSRFANGAFVSAGDFAVLVSSYADFSDVLFSIATAAQNGSRGFVYVSGSSNVTLYSAGAVGVRLLNTATTAAAQQQLGGGTVGRIVFEAVTTASAQQGLGGTTVGRALFEASTTAAVQSLLGGAVSGATQAEMEAASASAVFVTPERMRDHPAMPKVIAAISGGTTPELKYSYNVANLIRIAAGEYHITFSRVMSSTSYGIQVTPMFDEAAGRIIANAGTATRTSAGGCGAIITNTGGTGIDARLITITVFGDH